MRKYIVMMLLVWAVLLLISGCNHNHDHDACRKKAGIAVLDQNNNVTHIYRDVKILASDKDWIRFVLPDGEEMSLNNMSYRICYGNINNKK